MFDTPVARAYSMCLIPLLRVHASGIHSTDTGVYYAHTRDAGGDLRPLRHHEQLVSFKKSLLFYGHDTPTARACLTH